MRIALSFVLALALGSAAGAQAQAASTASASAPTKAGKPARALKASKPKPKPEVEAPEPESLEEERMAVAPMVLIGDSQCEFGQRISLRPHPTLAGRFLLEHRGLKHVLTPLPTTTGVVRLEERRTGMVWLQVPVKSMLMDGKKGQRVADNCMHPTQAQAPQEESTALQ